MYYVWAIRELMHNNNNGIVFRYHPNNYLHTFFLPCRWNSNHLQIEAGEVREELQLRRQSQLYYQNRTQHGCSQWLGK